MGTGLMTGCGIDFARDFSVLGSTGHNEAMFRSALKSVNGSQTQMILLLSMELLQKALIPFGHLAEIAERCQIRIDLGSEVPPGLRQVSLAGTAVANAMAAYFLQERSLQYKGSYSSAGSEASLF